MSDVAYFSLDKERQCRARGHVFERDFRHPNGEFEFQAATDCFRCGAAKTTTDAAAAESELARAP